MPTPARLVEAASRVLPRRWGYGYAFAFGLAATLVATLIALGVSSIGPHSMFLTLFPAVVIASGVAGWPAGASSLSAAAAIGWLLVARGGPDPSSADLLAFIASAAIGGGAAALMNTAVRRLAVEKKATERANASLRASEEHHRGFLELSPQMPWTADATGKIVAVSSRLTQLTGEPPQDLLGGGWGAIVHPDDLPRIRAGWRVSVASGAPFDCEHRVRLAEGGWRWVRSRAYASRSPEGDILTWYGLSEDVQDRKVAEEARELLTREVDHRARNLLSVVQSIARLTPDTLPERFVPTFLGRLSALAAAHGLLAESGWEGVPLRDLAAKELCPFGGAEDHRVEMDGPPVVLRSQWVQALGMILHELATNSSKYGALSSCTGRLQLCWRLQGDDRLRLDWIESGGPPVSAPHGLGFGSTLIERNARLDPSSRVRFDWRPEGLRFSLELSLPLVTQPCPQPRPRGAE